MGIAFCEHQVRVMQQGDRLWRWPKFWHEALRSNPLEPAAPGAVEQVARRVVVT